MNLRNILPIVMTLDSNVQRGLQMCFDIFALFIALVSAMFLRLETFTFLDQPGFFVSFSIIVVPTILIFAKMGLYRAFIRFVSTEIAVLVAVGSFLSSFFVILAKLTISPYIPWSSPIIFCALIFILITGSRFILRTIINKNREKFYKNIAIYGAGASGAQIVQILTSSSKYKVQMIIDDNPRLQGRSLYGYKVMSFEEASHAFETIDVDIILLAIPDANFAVKQNIIFKVKKFKLQVQTIPPLSNLIEGSARITEFRDVLVEDLLGRDRVDPISTLLDKNIYNRTVLVTGAGGTIGSELCRQILILKPKKLILIDVSELGVYNINLELKEKSIQLGVSLIPLIGAVQDESFVANTLIKHAVEAIFHAAAYKHVPLMEQNVMQAIKNNTIGTFVLAEQALRAKVSSFTLISTDKAVNPTNIMGASKRLAERICQTMDAKQNHTRFSIVRFGNVLGSSGSVVPMFQKQIAAGGPITLTHPEVTRYFMTINEAAQLVIQSCSLAKGGEVFVLDMGMPVKIKDLAFNMVLLSGLHPYLEADTIEKTGDIAIRIIGLRPGEKMYEELSYADKLIGTIHPRIMTVNETTMSTTDLHELMNNLNTIIATQDHKGLIKYLTNVADYKQDKYSEIKTTWGSLEEKQESQNEKIVSIKTSKRKN